MRATPPAERRANRSSRLAPKGDGSRRRRDSGGGEEGGGGLSAVKDQAGETVAAATRRMRDKGGEYLDRQKDRAAAELEGIGDSIRIAARDMAEGPLGAVSGYVRSAADAVAGVSHYLAEQDLQGLRRDVENAVRGRPQLFLGGDVPLGSRGRAVRQGWDAGGNSGTYRGSRGRPYGRSGTRAE